MYLHVLPLPMKAYMNYARRFDDENPLSTEGSNRNSG